METEWRLFPIIKKWGTRKSFVPQEPHGVLFGINRNPDDLVFNLPGEKKIYLKTLFENVGKMSRENKPY